MHPQQGGTGALRCYTDYRETTLGCNHNRCCDWQRGEKHHFKPHGDLKKGLSILWCLQLHRIMVINGSVGLEYIWCQVKMIGENFGELSFWLDLRPTKRESIREVVKSIYTLVVLPGIKFSSVEKTYIFLTIATLCPCACFILFKSKEDK